MNFDPGIDRRSLLQRAFLLVGAAALPGGAEALAAAVKSGKRQLDAPHYALLTAFADTVLPKTDTPGAVEVGVPQYVDALIGVWASPERRVALTGALEKLDSLARESRQRGFAALTPAERAEVLAPHDVAALKQLPKTSPPAIPVGAAPTTVDPQVARPKEEPVQGSALMAGPRFADPGYGKLKELVVVVFYCSETALTHDLAYEHAPGEWQPSIPITPDTRPWGGLGLI